MGEEERRPFGPALQVSEASISSRAPTRPISEDGEVKHKPPTMNSWKRCLPGLQLLREYQPAWFARDLMGNIANLLSHVQLFDEALPHFKRSLELDPESSYAHERMSSTLNKLTEELERLSKVIEEAASELERWRWEHPSEPVARPTGEAAGGSVHD